MKNIAPFIVVWKEDIETFLQCLWIKTSQNDTVLTFPLRARRKKEESNDFEVQLATTCGWCLDYANWPYLHSMQGRRNACGLVA